MISSYWGLFCNIYVGVWGNGWLWHCTVVTCTCTGFVNVTELETGVIENIVKYHILYIVFQNEHILEERRLVNRIGFMAFSSTLKNKNKIKYATKMSMLKWLSKNCLTGSCLAICITKLLKYSLCIFTVKYRFIYFLNCELPYLKRKYLR